MFLEITTPDQTLYKGEVSLIQLPGIDGSFEILEGHAPLVSALKKGKIKIEDKQDSTTKYFEINGGVIEVQQNKVIILAE